METDAMISPALQQEVGQRVITARRLRCGDLPWVEPPEHWPRILEDAWPSLWPRAPWSVAVGLVDVLMAMSEHVAGIDPAAEIVDAFMNVLDGSLGLRVSFRVKAVGNVVDAYAHMSRNLCGCCGFEGLPVQRNPHRPTVIRCATHAGDE